MDLLLKPWQRRFLTAALAPGVRTAALSMARGNGKSTLIAHLAHRFLTPGDSLHVRGTEAHICAASIGQARRTVFKLLREFIESGADAADYRIAESALTCHIVHVATNTRVSVLASSGRTSQGLVRCPFVFADEPGAWEVTGGELLHSAIQTAMGKPGCNLRAVYIGTLAPATGGWWHGLIHAGSDGSTHVTALEGDRAKWDRASEIRRCNPLMWHFAESRAVLLDERNKARRDTRLKASFLSYRLNVPTADESRVLLTIEDWAAVCARPVPPRAGRPFLGVDLGGGRSFSAAVALWRSGRCESVAIAPGIPGIREQERRDRVPAGVYQALVDAGVLRVATGRRVPAVSDLLALVRQWGPAESATCDRFRLSELRDAAPGLRLLPRVSRWSESTEDVRALRRLALDGDLGVEPASRGLLTASLAAAVVSNDDSGNVRMVKRTNNVSRDDVAFALVLAAGALARAPRRTRLRHVIIGAA